MKKLLVSILDGVILISLIACNAATAPTLKEESLTIEYGQNPYKEIQLEDLLENYDGIKEEYQFSLSLFNADEEEIKEDSITEDALLQVGEYTLKIDYADDVDPLQLPVTIKDTVAPEFKDFKEKVSVDYGYDKDLTKLFSAEDLSEVTISIEGDVDTKKAGDYKVTVIAEDASGNKTEKECTITVKEKPKASNSSSSNNNVVSSGSSGSGSSSASKPSGNSGSSSGSGNTSDNSSSSGDKQESCSIDPGHIGNSGKIFSTEEEAFAWAEAYIENDDLYGKGNITSYFVGATFDTCGNFIGYTVDFSYEGWTLPDF